MTFSTGQLANEYLVHLYAFQPSLSIFFTLLSGTATTTSTVYAFLNILIHHPEVQDKLYKEIHEQIGNRDPTIADKYNLP